MSALSKYNKMTNMSPMKKLLGLPPQKPLIANAVVIKVTKMATKKKGSQKAVKGRKSISVREPPTRSLGTKMRDLTIKLR